MENIGLNPPMD